MSSSEQRLRQELDATVSLRTLVRDTVLGLEVVGRTDISDRSVSWVYISELPFPGPWLDGGELVATMGQWLRNGDITADEYVANIVRAGAGALVFSCGPPAHDLVVFPEMPREVIAAADAHGLPLLGMTPETTFLSVSKTVAYLVATQSLAQLTAVLDAEQLLSREATAGDGLRGVCRRLALLVDAWVVLLSPAGDVYCAHSETGVPRVEPLFQEIRSLQHPHGPSVLPLMGGPDPVVAYVLGDGRRVNGYLLIGRSRPASAMVRRVINVAVTLLALMLHKCQSEEALERRLKNRFARDLLQGNAAAAEQLADLIGVAMPIEPVYVLASKSRLPAGEASRATWRLLIEALSESLVAADADAEIALISAHAEDVIARVRAALGDLSDRVVGLVGPVPLVNMQSAVQRARAALRQAVRDGKPMADLREMGPGGLLDLLPPEQALEFARDMLGPLLEEAGTARGDLLATLRAWLAHHGQWDPTAVELGIHRHTLRNRIDRVEQLLKIPLESAGQRMELWAALEVLDRKKDSSSR